MTASASTAAEPAEPVLYVDDARYARLWALWKEARSQDLMAGEDSQGEVTRLLYREARLLDDCRYDPWLAMFAPECI